MIVKNLRTHRKTEEVGIQKIALAYLSETPGFTAVFLYGLVYVINCSMMFVIVPFVPLFICSTVNALLSCTTCVNFDNVCSIVSLKINLFIFVKINNLIELTISKAGDTITHRHNTGFKQCTSAQDKY